MASDGQVTFGNTVVKQSARKIRRLYNDRVLAGFAGSAADSFALFARFEAKLEQYRGNLERSAVELAKDWRTDRALRRLEAMLVVMDPKATYLLSGTGDLIEPDDGIIAIGSGGPFAMAAAKALAQHTDARRPRHRAGSDEDRRRDLHLHQREHHDRRRCNPDGHSASRIHHDHHRGADAAADRRRTRQARRRPGGRPSAPSRSRCATARAGRSCRRSWPRRSRRRTS